MKIQSYGSKHEAITTCLMYVKVACDSCSTHFSIQRGFSVVFRSSIICFLIKASFRRISVGMEITQFLRQKHKMTKLMAPTKRTINKAIIAARAMSNSSGAFDGNAGITFSIAKPYEYRKIIVEK